SEPTLPVAFRPLLAQAPPASVERAADWAIGEVDVKPFCTARQTQAAVEAARIAAAGIDPAAIEATVVEVPEVYAAMIDRPAPGARMDSITSAQYQVACGIAAPHALHDVVREDLVTVPRAVRLMARLVVRPAADLGDQYPSAWGA